MGYVNEQVGEGQATPGAAGDSNRGPHGVAAGAPESGRLLSPLKTVEAAHAEGYRSGARLMLSLISENVARFGPLDASDLLRFQVEFEKFLRQNG